jgi:hypothetical protein
MNTLVKPLEGVELVNELFAMVEATEEDRQILASLQDIATRVAISLKASLARRFMEYPFIVKPMENCPVKLSDDLRDWFILLFRSGLDNKDLFARLRARNPLSTQQLLTVMDEVLRYGHQVTDQHPQPERAASAFHKSLVLDIAAKRYSEHQQLQHITEMLLLD